MHHILRSLGYLALTWLVTSAPAFGCSDGMKVEVTPVDFGVYDPLNPLPLDSTGTIRVLCTGMSKTATTYEIVMSSAHSRSGATRQLVGGQGSLGYDLFVDPARVSIWRDGVGGTGTVRGVLEDGVLSEPRHSIYGRIFPRQRVAAGTYTDQVTVSIFF